MFRLTVGAAALVLVTLLGGWVQAAHAIDESRAFYTEDQAQRGKALFAQSCLACHSVDGSKPRPMNLAGNEFLQEWYSVGDLFSKVSMSMPGNNVNGLSTDTYVTIVAYLLQVNGLPAGKDQLKGDRTAMRKMVLSDKESTKVGGGIRPVNEQSGGYYSAQQAKRGKAYFQGSCGLCHTADPPGPNQDPYRIPAPSGMGFWIGSERVLLGLVGDLLAQKYRTVGGLFNKLRTTMPAYDGGGLTTEEYLDMVAYLLEANGFPAGKDDLKVDLAAMRNMTIEKGFERLFNGKDLTGWGFLVANNCAPRPSGCGQIVPGSTFKVEKETIVCSGKPQGYMYPKKKYLNFTLRLEYRYTPYEGMEGDDDFYGNSGYMLFITNHQVMPKAIEVQGRNAAVLSIIPMNSKVKYTVDDDARKRAIKPVGQWNSVEIVSKDGQVKSSLNGTLVSTISEHEFKEPGYIGFQSESAEIRWRNIRIREE